MIHQLTYESQAVYPRGDLSDQDILREAITRNTGFSVTGFLVRTPKGFVQMLEGHHSAVQGLYAMIVRDHRHMRPRVLDQRDVKQRAFPNWSMGYADTDMLWLHSAPVEDVQAAIVTLAGISSTPTDVVNG